VQGPIREELVTVEQKTSENDYFNYLFNSCDAFRLQNTDTKNENVMFIPPK